MIREDIMTKNTGKEYEKLTQYIFNQIVNENRVENIEVQHNVTLQGKSTSHQIDVYWKFEVGGEEYCAIVQAKDWKNKVPQVEMLAFNDIIRDLPYGTKGIFVSLNGFQKGAIDVAKTYGITICELRPPKDEDWDGYIKTVEFELNIMTPVYKNINVSIDGDWLRSEGISDISKFQKCIFSADSGFYDAEGNEYTNLMCILRSLAEKNQDEVKHIKYEFDQDTFVYFNNKYIKIKSLEGDIGYSCSTSVMTIDAEEFTSYVLKNIISGDVRMFNKDQDFPKMK